MIAGSPGETGMSVAILLALLLQKPDFPGTKVRESYDPGQAYARGFDVPILLSSGRHIAVLDPAAQECVFVALEGGGITRVKTEVQPAHLVEKNGKVYVANRKSRSLTIIDAKTLKPSGKIDTIDPPCWLAAPEWGDVVYVVLADEKGWIKALDTKTQKLTTIQVAGTKGGVTWPVGYAAVLPDNRTLYLQSPASGSPSAPPRIYGIRDGAITDLLKSNHHDHPSALLVDFAGARVYSGSRAYTLDLYDAVDLPCDLAVPHRTLSLVFGRSDESAEKILVLDEETLGPVTEIEFGEPVLGLVPVDRTLYVLGRTHLRAVGLENRVPAEALGKKRKPRLAAEFAKTVPDADVRKARALIDEARTAAEGGRMADARKKLDEASKLDPFSASPAFSGMILVREKKYEEAIAFLRLHKLHAYRTPAERSVAYNQLGIALGLSGQAPQAIDEFREGIQRDPDSVILLQNFGVTLANEDHAAQAWCCWARCLEISPKDADVRKLLDDLTKRLIAATSGACAWCKGTGKRTEWIEEEDGGAKKDPKSCDGCGATGKAWMKPCRSCFATGETRLGVCRACRGFGSAPAPIPK